MGFRKRRFENLAIPKNGGGPLTHAKIVITIPNCCDISINPPISSKYFLGDLGGGAIFGNVKTMKAPNPEIPPK